MMIVDEMAASCITGSVGDTFCQNAFGTTDISCVGGKCVCSAANHAIKPGVWACQAGRQPHTLLLLITN